MLSKLEGVFDSLIFKLTVVMGVVLVMEDGEVLTGYYGDHSPEDIARMAYHLNMDSESLGSCRGKNE